MRLDGKVAVVTGAASPRGLGYATALELAGLGAHVALVDLDEELARRAAVQLGDAHRGFGCDVRDPVLCRDTVTRIRDAMGPPGILLAFAGISNPTRFPDIGMAEYEDIVATNLGGTFSFCQHVLPSMVELGGGAIVCVGSVAAHRGAGIFGGAHYAASKGAVHSLAKSLARELGPLNIRVNAIAPGLIETDIIAGRLDPAKQSDVVAGIPLRRAGRPSDVAKVCAFLVSEDAGYVTGSVIDINGGLHIH